ncbi:MAG: hypothetical protein P8Y99_14365 [Calditrichaceae bacterium]
MRFTVVFISLFFSVNVFGQVNTNQQIAEIKTIGVLDSIASKLPDSLKTVALEINLDGRDIKSFLLNQFAQYFAGKNIMVSLDLASYKVVFENFDIMTEYQETKKGMLGLSSNIKRQMIFNINGFIVNNTGKDIVDTFRYNSIYDDVVKSSDLNLIENSKYNFCHGKMIKASSWTKYIEPGIVISTVAGVVFLLFTMRF